MSKMEDLNKYQKKTDREHILDNPDTYIGSIELVDSDEFILSTNEPNEPDDINKATITKLSINRKKIHYIPGLYKLFDEGIVNCRDHVIRMQQKLASGDKLTIPVTNIEIDILDDGTITMCNDGNGIDIAEHPEYKIWIPELIFGHLRTSTNYDKTEKKIVGGKNGFGFKLVLVWSVWGKIETVDHTRGLKYVQEFHNNLETIDKPKITKATKTKPYTKVYFKPDYKRLGLPGLTDDIIRLLKRRVYDIAAVTDKSVKVKLNNEVVPVKNFCNYISLILGGNDYKHEESNERWEYAVALTPIGEFMQVSFVNGIYTNKGGKQVEYILNQITKKLIDYIKQKKKVDVKPSVIKEQIALFIRCDIENPAFDSQTKDYMNLPAAKFGSSCTVSDKFIDKIAKMGLMNTACDITDIKENKNAKKSDGNKTRSIRGIPKLIDANYAGTNKSNECTIILCEGDSAKSGIVSGLSREDRNYIGIYPMKGKLFNIRGECIAKINENKEISEIKQILGLEHGRTYTSDDVKTILRYGKVLFMTDQDLDGSHIKGLGINMIDTEWRSLIEIPEFIGYMNTPILKATRANNVVEFYNNGEFEVWKKDNDVSKYKIKYYKGLGTSTGTEFKEYFKKKKIVYFVSNGESCINTIDMVFNKKRSNDRKTWLEKYDRESYLDTSKDSVSYEEFIDNDLIHFSKYDNDRSIPNLIDGLKISQRKILCSAFKKNLTSEIKVAQFSGYVSEQSGYHHGEASLNGTIIGLAQDFVGSNNINLFEPLGQHGTRIKGGKDAASERYIFTNLNRLTRLIFPEIDNKILTYLDDDGVIVEPIYYVPIIPMVLVNGCKGIGTGFSTDIMCHNPLQIIEKLECLLNYEESHSEIEIEPYYKGFRGTIEKIPDHINKTKYSKYLLKGIYEKIGNDKIRITELPIGSWTQDYKEFLESLITTSKDKGKDKEKATSTESYIKDYTDMSTDTNVEFIVSYYPGMLIKSMLEKHENGIDGVQKLLKLYCLHSTSNMHLFNEREQLKHYDNVNEIIEEYYSIRLEYYNKRRTNQIDQLNKELIILSNKAKYIGDTLDDKIDLRKKSRDTIDLMMEAMKFEKIETNNTLNFNYLIKMPMDSVCQENVDRLMKETGDKQIELEKIKATNSESMWLKELSNLKQEYLRFIDRGQNICEKDPKSKVKSKK